VSTFQFSKPSADGFSKDDHEDHTLVFVEPAPEDMSTSYGDTTAARCAYVVCLDDDQVYSEVLIFGTALVPALTDPGEELVVGHLVKGTARPGRNAPWLLEDPTDNELGRAEAFFTAHARREESGRIVVEKEGSF
jgi:hypothetical protein